MQLQLFAGGPLAGTERELIGLAVALGALNVKPVSSAELDLARAKVEPAPHMIARAREEICEGSDPLGDSFCAIRSPLIRRSRGATYTPLPIVKAMLAWAREQRAPERVVDPGAGSGRFIVNAGRAFAKARLVAIELDPVAALLARAHIAAAGLQERAEVQLSDYRSARLAGFRGRTLFIGNPPYVRHHALGQDWKEWLTRSAKQLGFAASQLAGLHVHFFLSTVHHAARGDVGCFITAAEWLDVNYGEIVRKLFLGPLGGTALHVIEPTAAPFPDAQATGAITCFQVGAAPRTARIRRVSGQADLGALDSGRQIRREQLAAASRWTPLTHATRKTPSAPSGYVELGELCRVKRGQVTGANRFWIAGEHAAGLPKSVLYPTVTKARELYVAGKVLADSSSLRKVIDLPEDLEVLAPGERRAIDALLAKARAAHVDRGYVARHRRAWWSVGLYEPAPILATYMARRPPGFVRNPTGARNINIAHGLYPRVEMNSRALDALAEYLSREASLSDGRTYAGGLTKFEPKEMERIMVPSLELFAAS